MLVHVVDASATHPDQQITAVREVLAEIGADSVPEFIVFNKADLVDDWGATLVDDYPGSVVVSALKNEGLDLMLKRLSDRMRSITRVTDLLVPYDRGDIVASIHREGEVVLMEDMEGGLHMRARLSEASEGRLREFVVKLDDDGNLIHHD
jgi:GTP-binding protein HflX